MGKDPEEEIFRGQRVNDEVSKRFLSMDGSSGHQKNCTIKIWKEKTILAQAKALTRARLQASSFKGGKVPLTLSSHSSFLPRTMTSHR